MSNLKHTPGPWSISALPLTPLVVADRPEGRRLICDCDPDGDFDDELEEDCANAHLIAAAPDMLEALYAIASECMPVGFDARVCARAAIAKATGGAS